MPKWDRATNWWRDQHIVTEEGLTDLATCDPARLLRRHPEKALRLVSCASTRNTIIPEETRNLLRTMCEWDLHRDDLTEDFGYTLMSPDPVRTLRMMGDLRMFDWISPDVAKMIDMNDRGHKNVWEHTLTVMENGGVIPDDVFDAACAYEDVMNLEVSEGVNLVILRTRLSLLLHDIGKSVTRSYGRIECKTCDHTTHVRDIDRPNCDHCGEALTPTGELRRRPYFKYHEVKAGPIVRSILSEDLNFPPELVEWVVGDCTLHGTAKRGTYEDIIRDGNELQTNQLHQPAPKKFIERLTDKLRDSDDPIIGDLNEAVRWHIIASDASGHIEEQRRRVETLRGMIKSVREQRRVEARQIESVAPLLSGDELQKMFGLPPGRWIGEAHRRMVKDRKADPEGHTRTRAIEIAREVFSEMDERGGRADGC